MRGGWGLEVKVLKDVDKNRFQYSYDHKTINKLINNSPFIIFHLCNCLTSCDDKEQIESETTNPHKQ